MNDTICIWPPQSFEKGVGYQLPERPEGCCAQLVPDPFFKLINIAQAWLLRCDAAPSPGGSAGARSGQYFPNGPFEPMKIIMGSYFQSSFCFKKSNVPTP